MNYVHDRYRLERRLGKGGMGEVYQAIDTHCNDRVVALKLLPPDALRDPAVRERFRMECKFAGEINHPNVLPVFDYSDGDLPYIAMQYADGVDLGTELENGASCPHSAVTIISQIASALDAAHARELRHRDVKPSNIMLGPGWEPGTDHAWLFDWGIAQQITATELTQHGTIVGSTRCIAPERLDPKMTSDHRADVYSLAVVLYECLAGVPPFVGEDMAVLTGHLSRTPPDLPPMSRPRYARSWLRSREGPGRAIRVRRSLAQAAREALTVVEPVVGLLPDSRPEEQRIDVWPRRRPSVPWPPLMVGACGGAVVAAVVVMLKPLGGAMSAQLFVVLVVAGRVARIRAPRLRRVAAVVGAGGLHPRCRSGRPNAVMNLGMNR